jgi:hypothetical protein
MTESCAAAVIEQFTEAQECRTGIMGCSSRPPRGIFCGNRTSCLSGTPSDTTARCLKAARAHGICATGIWQTHWIGCWPFWVQGRGSSALVLLMILRGCYCAMTGFDFLI